MLAVPVLVYSILQHGHTAFCNARYSKQRDSLAIDASLDTITYELRDTNGRGMTEDEVYGAKAENRCTREIGKYRDLRHI